MQVHGEGNPLADIVFIGEAPGADEDRTGHPFVGKAGRELDRLLRAYLHSITRDDVFITNVVRERPVTKAGQNREPTAAEIERDLPFLYLELGSIAPSVVVTLGRTATRVMLGDVDMETVHGIPQQADEYVVFPAYHPAAALHSPELQALLAYDFERLGAFLRGRLDVVPPDDGIALYGIEQSPQLNPLQPIAIDTEGWVHKPWGLSFSQAAREGWVIRADDTEALARFNAQLQQQAAPIILHSALHDLAVLAAMGVTPPHFTDTMVLAYLLCLEPQGLKPLAYRHAQMYQASYEDIVGPAQARLEELWLDAATLPEKVKKRGRKSKVGIAQWWKSQTEATRALVVTPFPEATLDDVDPEVAIRYSARDADATLRVHKPLSDQITALGLDEVAEVDCAIVPMIDRMQQVGIKADPQHFADLAVLLDLQMAMVGSQIDAYAGKHINPASGDQVAEYIFTTLRLPHGKKTKSGARYSTIDSILEGLRDKHPVVGLILDYREAQKLKGTYVDPMPQYIRADGRLHPKFRTTRVASGRLAASEPNVLAFPKHSELGKLVRMGFLADDGHELGEWDLDQIEMRVMAHDSGDAVMIAEFLSGIDKHTSTAARIFGKRPEDVKRDTERFAAKAVNFGILMGMTAVGLTAQFHKNGQAHWTEEDCQKLLDEYFKVYTGVRDYINAKHTEARRYGYVRDMWNRVRYLPGVQSPDRQVREEALRQAQATPIQSGAQGIIKRIMRALWPEICQLRRSSWVEPLLQIHDALIFEYEEAVRDVLDQTVMRAMRETVTLRIPVTAKGTRAQRWGDL